MELPKNKTIKITPKDYKSKLNILPSLINRPITEAHVNLMRESVISHGVLRDVILVYTDIFTGKSRYYIADGQHLTKVLVSLNLTFNAKVIKADSVEDLVTLIANLNNTSKSWTNRDYLNAWCATGKQEYLYLREISRRYSRYTIDTLLRAFGSRSKAFKDGAMQVNKKLGEAILQELNLMAAIVPVNTRLIRNFIKVYNKHRDVYNSSAFMTSLLENKAEITKYVSQEVYIYNKFTEMITESSILA
ncbi:MAG: hypothetical protein ACW98D_21430 [Promethearchaeota archaeon]|jgi:hypothetical protein